MSLRYLALGDSISIDAYTEVKKGGAVSQFARRIGATQLQDLTQDGFTTDRVLESLEQVVSIPDVVTVTAGGNDLLMAAYETPNRAPLENLERICGRLAEFGSPVILNAVYDPTDGDDSLAELIGVTPEFRPVFKALNAGIRELAEKRGFLFSDLEALFRGHGIEAAETWITGYIEPNYLGASAIARHWERLYKEGFP